MTTYGTNPQPRRRWLPIAAAVVVGLALVGVGVGVFFATRDNDADQRRPGGVTVAELQSQQASLPACGDVFAPGKAIDAALPSAGFQCRNSADGVVVLAAFDCQDGRHLWSTAAADAGRDGWGFSGGEFHPTATAVASDAGYATAYAACHG